MPTELATRTLTTAAAINEALAGEMERDPDVIVLGEDVGHHGGMFAVTRGLMDRFGARRVIDTPISETGFIGAAIGAAIMGMRPVAEIMYVDFTGVCLDQIINHAAKMRYMSGGQLKVPLVIRTNQGAGKGTASQHSQTLETIFAHIPGLKVALPATPADAKGLLTTAIRDDNPVMFLEHKALYAMRGEVPEGEYTVPFGKARIVREGTDVTVVALARMNLYAEQAAEVLDREGISVQIVDPRTLTPFDAEMVCACVARTHRLLVVEEAVAWSSVGGSIVQRVVDEAFDELDAPPRLVGARFTPVPYAESLEGEALPGPGTIADAIRAMLGHSRTQGE